MAARLSLVAALATVAVAILTNLHGDESLKMVFWLGLLRIIFMVGGLTLAVIAIAGSIAPRPHTLLFCATMGLAVNGVAILLAVFSFIGLIIASGKPPDRPPPPPREAVIPIAVETPTRIHSNDLHFSVEIPAGFQDNPEALRNPLVAFGFYQQYSNGIRSDINIQPLGRTIEPGPVDDTDLQIIADQLPPGSKVERTTEQWNNHTIAGLHYRIPQGDDVIAVYTARIPLQQEAIQINVGGPIAGELKFRNTLRTLLQSLQADANWETPPPLPGIYD